MLGLSRNPFVLRNTWREQRPWSTVECWVVGSGTVLTALFAVWVAGLLGLLCIGVAGLALMTFGMASEALLAGVSSFERERRGGALELTAIIPMAPRTETVGRWAASLRLAVRYWLAGWVFVAVTEIGLQDADRGLAVLLFWLFCGVWMSALAALSLVSASLFVRAETALLAVVVPLLGGLGMSAGAFDPARYGVKYIAPAVLSPAAWLPPEPLAPFALLGDSLGRGTSIAPWMMGLVSWTAFAALMLCLATMLVRARVPHLGFGCSNGPVRKRLQTSARRAHACLLPAFRNNPLYSAWRAAGRTDRPALGASLAVGVFVSVGALVLPQAAGPSSFPTAADLNAQPMFALVSNELAGVLMLMLLSYLALGACFGHSAMTRELKSETWPLLVMTGLSPRQVVDGRFSVLFQTASSSWLVPLPFFLLLAPGGWPVTVLLCPVALAAGLMLGIGFAAASKRLASVSDYVMMFCVVMLSAGIVGLGVAPCLYVEMALAALQALAGLGMVLLGRRFAYACTREWMT